ncbi:MAG TPA: DEAD/DEAH box helicase [Bryobacteraceae bacterium]|nr:DEAD/DEAH box helicase [Bryobacteraceae bacterium]
MNLSLGFPDFSEELALARQPNLEAALAHFRALMQKEDSPIRAIRHQPARQAEYVDIPESAHARLREGLVRRNIPKLYSHQAEAFEKVTAGHNVVVVTPTASGKTLCFNLPVLDLLLRDPDARAIYIYPTKALAEDQLHEFQSLVEDIGSDLRAFTYDGDTPQDARKAIRQRAGVVMTNPDMLHAGILPHHTKWVKVLEKLRYIIIDELHYYRGVYGSHFANLLRRLLRICEFYGSKPQFICSSATIANPRELAVALTAAPFEMVDRNGAPAGEKYFLFYNPPVVNRQLGIRRSYISETRRIALEFIERGQQTLVFANNRLATEILVTYLKDACDRKPLPPETVRGYRGGYLPRERREIERLLRDGEIRAVVATNALELGIDIGSLDAVVMAGYAGTIASTWQRAGRAGRRQSTSAAVLVASSAPLDQYIVEHPDYFFDRPPESAYINPDNLEILLGHLKCAAFELPIQNGEKFGRHETGPLCGFLEEAGFLHHSAKAWHWTSQTYPADAIGLRSITSDNFVVVDITSEPAVIAEVSFTAALTTLHEKAIYLHEARQYQVERFDYEERKAYVRRVDSDYYTDAIDYTQVKTLEEFESAEIRSGARRVHGEARVNRQIVGFKKIKFYTNENVGAGKLSMPEQEMHTTAFWLHFPAAFLAQFGDLSPTDKQDGIIGLGHALRTIGSLLLMCDPRDLGVAISEEIATGLEAFEPNLYLYDNYSGGIGQSAPLFKMTAKLLTHAAQLLDGCACDAGCPSCVGPLGEVGERGKLAARRILAALIGD